MVDQISEDIKLVKEDDANIKNRLRVNTNINQYVYQLPILSYCELSLLLAKKYLSLGVVDTAFNVSPKVFK